jgi:acetyltransferase
MATTADRNGSPWVVAARAITLRDGTSVWLRQIAPDDGRLIVANFPKATAEEIHQRFFEYLKSPPQTLIDRLIRCDAACELALVAVPLPGEGEPDDAYGAVRLAADMARGEAEYAIIIRHDWQGRGLGWALTRSALDEALRRGIARIFALVLNENVRMIRMLRGFGFSIASDVAEPGVVRAELALTPAGARP